MVPYRQLGDFEVYPDRNRVLGPDGEHHLEPRVMDVLCLLIERAGTVVSRREILSRVWPDTVVGEEAVTRCISELRKTFGESAENPNVIETIPKRGYRLPARLLDEVDVNTGEPAGPVLLALLSTTQEHVYVFDRQGRYLMVSDVGAHALGCEPKEMIGHGPECLGEMSRAMAPLVDSLDAVLEGAGAVTSEIRYGTIDGPRIFQYAIHPILHLGEVQGAIAYVQDLMGESGRTLHRSAEAPRAHRSREHGRIAPSQSSR